MSMTGQVARPVAKAPLVLQPRMRRRRCAQARMRVAAQLEAPLQQPEPAPEAKPRDDGVAIRRAAVTARRHAQCAGKALVR